MQSTNFLGRLLAYEPNIKLELKDYPDPLALKTFQACLADTDAIITQSGLNSAPNLWHNCLDKIHANKKQDKGDEDSAIEKDFSNLDDKDI